MFTSALQRNLLRWLLRELSTDTEDMIAFIAGLPDADDDDAQALLEELAQTPAEPATAPLQALYREGKQMLGPAEALALLNISRASFYALLKRGTFPAPVSIDDNWVGWPREVLLDWADTSARLQSATQPHAGYAPFERLATARSR